MSNEDRVLKFTVPVKQTAEGIYQGSATITMPFSLRFVVALLNAQGKVELIPGLSPEELSEAKTVIGKLTGYFLTREIIDLQLHPKTNKLIVKTKTLSKKEVDTLFKNVAVEKIIEGLLRELKPPKDKLHKQPRNLLKTVAKTISNTTAEATLFTIQDTRPEATPLGLVKEELNKTAGALAFYLIQLYQENNSKPLEITNLTPIAEVLKCSNYRLKLYLMYLGGYVYPIVDKDETTKELVLTNEQMFKIEFRYSQKVADKYTVDHRTRSIQGVERIGTTLLNFIKDEPLDRVIVTPSPLWLGNILTVSDKFIGLILEISPIAVKILSYSSSNQPKHRIRERNLVEHLGLNKQVKTQGTPRVRETILRGLEELKVKGHLKEYSYEPEIEMYTYTYSDTYVKFKEGKKGQKETP
jgi:hypothetical protein